MEDLKQWHLEEAAGMYKRALGIMVERSKKYASDDDPFLNFRRSADFAGTTVIQGIMTRIGDKLSRLQNTLEKDGADDEFRDESFDDTIIDIDNYLVILRNVRLHLRKEAAAKKAQMSLFEEEESESEEAPPQNPGLIKRLASTLGVTVD